VEGKRDREKNTYLSRCYPESTVLSLGSDYEVLMNFTTYLEEFM